MINVKQTSKTPKVRENEVFVERFLELLHKSEMTKKELADYIGCSCSSISHYITEDRLPSITRLIQIADLFGVTIDYLLGTSDEMHPADYNDEKLKLSLTDMQKIFIERFQNLVETSEISQRELAEELHCSYSSVCRYLQTPAKEERDGVSFVAWRFPIASKIVDISNYFGCSVDYLLGRTDDICR